MKIGTRVTLLTVMLVVLTLGLYGYISIRARQVELERDVERQTQLFGSSLRVALEAALQEGLYEDVRRLIDRMQKTDQPIQVVYLDLVHPDDSAAFPASGARGVPPGGGAAFMGGAARGAATGTGDPDDDERPYAPPPADPSREGRLRRVQISGVPYGEHVDISGRPSYGYMVPLRGKKGPVAVVDLVRDESEAQGVMHTFRRDVTLTVAALSLLLALVLTFSVRQAFSGPLLRLVGGIDEVTSGDYTGVILREKNDEVGTLADRFNEMTRSLRQAREEILAGVDAKIQLEMRLRQADKLATIGQLAAGIAHEVGTPLNVIGGRARAMARRAGEPETVQKNAEIIAAQAERITKIIQQLLDYARSKAPARVPVDVGRVAAVTLDFLEHQLAVARVSATLQGFVVAPPRAPVPSRAPPLQAEGTPAAAPYEWSGEVPLPPPISPVVVGDADQLQQVCLNLCLNAVQAMPEGGALELSLLGLVRRRPGLDRTPPGAYVMLAVSDTGVGIPEEDKERIFEPFYSTKLSDRPEGGERGGGTGLGLSVSAGIVKDHDGWIEIEGRRRPDGGHGGTIFRVYLPALDADGEDAHEERGARAPGEVQQEHGAAATEHDEAAGPAGPAHPGRGHRAPRSAKSAQSA